MQGNKASILLKNVFLKLQNMHSYETSQFENITTFCNLYKHKTYVRCGMQQPTNDEDTSDKDCFRNLIPP